QSEVYQPNAGTLRRTQRFEPRTSHKCSPQVRERAGPVDHRPHPPDKGGARRRRVLALLPDFSALRTQTVSFYRGVRLPSARANQSQNRLTDVRLTLQIVDGPAAEPGRAAAHSSGSGSVVT